MLLSVEATFNKASCLSLKIDNLIDVRLFVSEANTRRSQCRSAVLGLSTSGALSPTATYPFTFKLRFFVSNMPGVRRVLQKPSLARTQGIFIAEFECSPFLRDAAGDFTRVRYSVQ